MSRQPKSDKDVIRPTDLRESLGHRERRDSQRSEQGTLQPRVYTPAQFENSLGKLQVLSFFAQCYLLHDLSDNIILLLAHVLLNTPLPNSLFCRYNNKWIVKG